MVTSHKLSIILLSAILLCAGCAKIEANLSNDVGRVTARVELDALQSKAVSDGDGAAANIDRWIIEVRDILQQDAVYYREVKASEKGVRTQTFELTLVKNHTYAIAFWADKSGSYDVSNLQRVKFTNIAKIGNSDTFDAFFAGIQFTYDGTPAMNVKLYRPLAQVNVITTDLPDLKAGSTAASYASYEPKKFSFRTNLPTAFNVYNGEASEEQEVTITPEAAVDKCYASYAAAADPTTIFMVYVLGNKYANEQEKDIRNIGFSMKPGGVLIDCQFNSIPVKRNYRTNIIGSFLTNSTIWTVEVVPSWKSGDEGEGDLKASLN
ncbi:MAG: hypothetical protein KBT00_02660 [Bacteroidales bacterium]|nr:hypothetical protein [Candidatus Cacconaster merdequi]